MGVDIGGTKVLAVLVDAEGVVTDRALAKTQRSGPQSVADDVARLLAKLDPQHQISSVGVGMPGVISAAGVQLAVNLQGWDTPVDFVPLLSKATARKVTLANDVSMAAVAEHRVGSARGTQDALHIAVGTGVGGALVLDSKLRTGERGLAGEIGHTAVPNVRLPHASIRLPRPVCACGAAEHLEAYLGRAALERRARQAMGRGVASALSDLAGDSRMTSSVWLDALDTGDALATLLLDEATQALAVAITSAVTLLDVELVVVGGGFASRLGGAWRNRVAAMHAEMMSIANPSKIKGSGIGDNAAALGAALQTQTPSN